MLQNGDPNSLGRSSSLNSVSDVARPVILDSVSSVSFSMHSNTHPYNGAH